MFLEGSIFNGAVVLDESATLPDGTRVRIEPVETHAVRQPIACLQTIMEKLARGRDSPEPGPTLAEALARSSAAWRGNRKMPH